MLFEKVTKTHILQAIEDFKEKGYPSGFGPSSTYDVVFENEPYPPKTIMAYANYYAEGRKIENYFKGGEDTDCFKALERNGFMIKEKLIMIEAIKSFLEQAETDNLKTKHYLKSYKGLKVKVSFGAGNVARIPWIAILKEPNKVQDGIYPVLLFFKEVNKLVLAYGISETKDSKYNWGIDVEMSIQDWYNKEFSKNPERYGASKIKSVYDVNSIDYDDLNKKLNEVIDSYKSLNFTSLNEPEVDYKSNKETYFTWVKTFKELGNFLQNKKLNQLELIELLKASGCDIFNDQNPKDNVIELSEIDPFTFYCYLNKYFKKRLEIFKKLANLINISIPSDDKGLPSTNPQKVWLFPYKYERNENEINRLWNFFDSVLKDNVTEDQFQDILTIRGVANTKLTEVLFYTNPEKYFPINGPTKSYIKEKFGIDTKFKTYKEYLNILSKIKENIDAPFYEISYDAWLWNKNIENHKSNFLQVLKNFSQEDLETYFNFLDEIIEKFKIKKGDSRLVYTCGNKYLNLNIGQRFVWRLKPRKNQKFWIMTKEKFGKNYNSFDGDIKHYYTLFNKEEDLNRNRTSCFEAIEIELKRTKQSGYLKHNDEDFENAVFDKNFREKFMKKKLFKRNISSINQILYGPPGTGKTYFLKEQLFEKYTSKQTLISKEQYFESIVGGCSWWQVIAIALLDLKKGKVSDIFDHKWVQRKASLSNSKTIRPTLWGQLQSHTIQECEYVNVSSRQQPLIFNKTEDSYWEILDEEVKELVPELYDLKNEVENYNPDPENIIKHYDFVTFHQSFDYEDFIEGIKPILSEEGEVSKDLGYKIENGVFKSLCIRAKNDSENRYAIFIDEINRGNVSGIFGELITLIEVDKRSGAKNELSIKLPYSKEEFSVPSNLDIYGTMNTADRSVEALDTALRRRFEFKEMMPDYTVIENEDVKGVKLSKVLKTINERIELLIDRDHTIGHSYFFNVNSKEKLANAFNNKILPLLQEYFYGDYGKIGLVLGKGFVEKQKNDKINFADFAYENANDFKTPSFILKKVTKENIVEAVTILLGKNDSNLKE